MLNLRENFATNPGLKGHMTKMHKEKKNVDVTPDEIKVNCKNELKKEALDVVDSLLTEMFENNYNESTNVTLEENATDGKEYINICDQCDYKISTSKKYQALQLMTKHKEETHGPRMACKKCNFKGNDNLELNRHMRNKHEKISTSSTSPPLKKKKLLGHFVRLEFKT